MLVDAYAKRVFNMAYQFAGSYQEAQDLTQDIFLKLYRALPKYDFERDFTAWLVTLAKNHLIDAYRKTKWEKTAREDLDERTLAAEASDGPETALDREVSRQRVWQGLNHLSSEVRTAVILRDIQGKSYEEVAAVMNIPIGTLKSRINRGRLQLARILKDKEEGADGR